MQSIYQGKEEELRWDCGTQMGAGKAPPHHLHNLWLAVVTNQCSAVPQEFEGKTFTDVTREDLEIDESEEGKKESADVKAELKDLTSYVKKVMGAQGRWLASQALAATKCLCA